VSAAVLSLIEIMAAASVATVTGVPAGQVCSTPLGRLRRFSSSVDAAGRELGRVQEQPADAPFAVQRGVDRDRPAREVGAETRPVGHHRPQGAQSLPQRAHRRIDRRRRDLGQERRREPGRIGRGREQQARDRFLRPPLGHRRGGGGGAGRSRGQQRHRESDWHRRAAHARAPGVSGQAAWLLSSLPNRRAINAAATDLPPLV
jgi:hypothetical protein